MSRPFLPIAVLLSLVPTVRADDYVPPVPIGIAREGGKVRNVDRPIPFPSESAQWVRLRSPRFDVLSSASPARTREIVAGVETLAAALGGRPGARATLFLFESRRESQPYFDLLFARENSRATGAYVRHAGGGTIFIDASRRRGIERTAMHELIHDLLRERELTPPLWIEEGLAEYFSTAVVRGSRVIAGEPLREAVALLRRRPAMPLHDLFAVTAESDAAAAPGFYAQSWAAVDWLMRLDSEAFFPFVGDVSQGVSVEKALQSRYGRTLRDLEGAIRKRDARMHRVELEADVPEIADGIALERATLLYELGRFLSYVAGAEKETQRHYAEALRIDPKHARTLAATGQFEAAIAADPTDAGVHLLFAETLMTTATGPFAGIFEPTVGDVDRFRKARSLAEQGLALGADEGESRGLIGTSYLVEDDVTPGIAELERARLLVPQRIDFALNLYAMYFRAGDRGKADALYASAFEHARDRQTIFAARNVLVMAETARANALTAAGKLDEAAAAVRGLAVLTADPLAKRELELQAASLVSLAVVNRHITQYNEAIALLNTGHPREAARVLDALLKVATDEQVLRDAKKLRQDVRKRL